VKEVAGVITNRRADTRYPAEAVPEITGLRISPGAEATLVNISATGVLIDSAQRFAPGQRVAVHFEGRLPTKYMKARIVRCQVSAISRKGSLRYHTAMAFDDRLALPNEPAAADVPATWEMDRPGEIASPETPAVTNQW
jgi:hypothetical protein